MQRRTGIELRTKAESSRSCLFIFLFGKRIIRGYLLIGKRQDAPLDNRSRAVRPAESTVSNVLSVAAPLFN